MADPAFVELVGRLVESFGQSMGSSRQSSEAIYLQTTDGFLYAFISSPEDLSLTNVQRMLGEAPVSARHLVVFSRSRLPLALSSELVGGGATVVEGPHFTELAHSLGLGSYLGEEPRPAGTATKRLLPSAQQLDGIMARGKAWAEWGVPALALRFYDQAVGLKPEFLPARVGSANALLALGFLPEARRAFEEIRRSDPSNLEARVGEAAVLGAEGHVDPELAAYRALLVEFPDQLSVRAHLVAALVEHHRWTEAREELATMLETFPEDARLRYLHAVSLERTGSVREAAAERERARRIGLGPDQERALAEQLGLPAKGVPAARSPIPPALATPALAPATTPSPPPARVPHPDSPPPSRSRRSATGRRAKPKPASRRGRPARKRN